MNLPVIKDKSDTESVEQLILIGFPYNEQSLPELVYWSCFSNDPVGPLAYPYISSLRDDILVAAVSGLLEQYSEPEQKDVIQNVFSLLVDDRGEHFKEQIYASLGSDKAKKQFLDLTYSIV